MEQRTWILATRNKGKAVEFESLLRPYGIKILTLDAIKFKGVIEETGTSFQENALIKVQAIQSTSGLPVLADDSGLEVEALDGAPGVYSARYAGKGSTDKENYTRLLEDLREATSRKARFVCCLAWVGSGKAQTFTGYCDGSIATLPRGKNGFGYDPVFVPAGYNMTLGELDKSVKESLSHRARAMKKLVEEIF